MPLVIQTVHGDGVHDDAINVVVSIPDDQSTILVSGSITPQGGTPVTVPYTSLASPTNPGSGNVYYIVQVDVGTGTPTIKQSTSAIPTPDANASGNGLKRVVYTQTIANGAAASDSLQANKVLATLPAGSP